MNPENFLGKIICKYKIIKIIGEGAFSTVCLAEEIGTKEDLKDNNISYYKKPKEDEKKGVFARKPPLKECPKKNYVACKIIPRIKVDEKKISTRLDQEIRINQMMHHPNVVQLIDVYKDDSFYYVFLEFCECGELFQIIIKKNRLSENEAAIYFKQILIGVQYIHSLNIAHRDLKPENILVDKFGRVKISDFGLSKLFNSKGLTTTPCGSPCYTSPEVISGLPYDGKKSDIWSCGVILYALTTGFLPWTQRVQSKMFEQIKNGEYSVPPFVSNTCADLIYRLMTVDPERRITIDEALNHPFLKDVLVPLAKLDIKYVSLRKVDRILSVDRSFEYEDIIGHISKGNSNSDSKYRKTLFKASNDIETSNAKKIEKRKTDNISLIVQKRKNRENVIEKNKREACHLFNKMSSKENIDMHPISGNDEKQNNKSKKKNNDITINLTLPYSVSPRKLNNRFKFMNQFGIPSLFPRRSEQIPSQK